MKEGLIKHNNKCLGGWSCRKIKWLSRQGEKNRSIKKKDLNYRQINEKL